MHYYGEMQCQVHECYEQATQMLVMSQGKDHEGKDIPVSIKFCADHYLSVSKLAPLRPFRAILDLECQLRASLDAANDPRLIV